MSISGIHTYKFVIPDTKRKQNIFLVFLKYGPSSHDFNKLVIKAKKYFFLNFCFVWKYDMKFLISLRDLVVCKKTIFFFYVFLYIFCNIYEKIRYFNTDVVFLSKFVRKIHVKIINFLKGFLKNFFFVFYLIYNIIYYYYIIIIYCVGTSPVTWAKPTLVEPRLAQNKLGRVQLERVGPAESPTKPFSFYRARPSPTQETINWLLCWAQ
jgi:hypothetical protein